MSAPNKHLLEMTESLFAALSWPTQTAFLRDLDNTASRCEGKTEREANEQRKPYAALHKLLQAIHDKQVAAWIKKGCV
jgi:hypothetical protein